jgi:methionine biosynthesis protein MetW
MIVDQPHDFSIRVNQCSSVVRLQSQESFKKPMPRKRYCMPDPSAVLTDKIIKAHITPGTRVIDMGCGDGRLLVTLRDQHQCDVLGVEVEQDEFVSAVSKGLPVIRADLDQGLSDIPDDSFDFAVLSQTLQQVRHPVKLLEEILRVAKMAIVVVPNFGHWQVRLQVLLQGRAPVTQQLPYQWYNTPNIHFMSMHDFRDLAIQGAFRIVKEIPIIGTKNTERPFAPNLRAKNVLYILERA